MIRYSDHQVELTDHELACIDALTDYLDQGFDTPTAVELVRTNHDIYGRLSPEFIAYMSE